MRRYLLNDLTPCLRAGMQKPVIAHISARLRIVGGIGLHADGYGIVPDRCGGGRGADHGHPADDDDPAWDKRTAIAIAVVVAIMIAAVKTGMSAAVVAAAGNHAGLRHWCNRANCTGGRRCGGRGSPMVGRDRGTIAARAGIAAMIGFVFAKPGGRSE